MGICASKKGGTTVVGVDSAAQDWNSAYADAVPRFASRASSIRHQNTIALGSDLAESTSMKISHKGANLTMVNGYKVAKVLGKGAFGEVFLASQAGERFAIKVLLKSKLKKVRTGRHSSAFDSIKTEIATMKKIAHPNCVHMFDVIIDQTHDEVFLVLEYVEGGPSQKIGEDGRSIPLAERTIWSHMRHLVMGLEYLHMHGIIHRDIKPENLLVTKEVQYQV